MKFKVTYSPQIRGSVAKKFISSSLAIGLLLNTALPSLASTLSEDGRYESFEGDTITIDSILGEDTADVEIEGNTMVNVANYKNPIPATKEYIVANTNHIPLQGNYDGKARPVIEGNTMYYNNDTGELSDTFVEGANLSLKSSFEDQLVTQEMVDSGQEKPENLGKYKVEYKVTGKNKFYGGDESGTFSTTTGLPVVTEGAVRSANFSDISGCKSLVSNIFITWYFYDKDFNFISLQASRYAVEQVPLNAKYLKVTKNGYVGDFNNLQIEEGTATTEYEPYKESIKTFYLSSPLLEGDTIEEVNGKATHVRRYGRVVLDGSDDEWFDEVNAHYTVDGYVNACTRIEDIKVTSPTSYSNNFKTYPSTGYRDLPEQRAYYDGWGYYLFIPEDALELVNIWGFKKWFTKNPTTIVYELETPIYETISEESILCDSYVNGHLDLNSEVPINKSTFIGTGIAVNYLEENTQYTVQFESDNVGYLDYFAIADINSVSNIPVSKGINRISISTTTSNIPYIHFNGIGFNASNIQVVATNDDFDYFEGMQSSFEGQLVTQEMIDSGQEKQENLGKYKVEVKSTGKNLLNDWMIGYIEDEHYPNPGSHTTSGCDENGHHLNSGIYRMCTDYVNIKPNTYYTLSKYRGGRTTFYDSNYNYISNIINENYSGYIYTPSNARYIRVHVDWWTGDMDTLKIQLEEGSVATEYEPYKESTKTFYLNSPLLEGDTIEYINGQATHIHRYGKVVFDDESNIQIDETLANTYRIKQKVNNIGVNYYGLNTSKCDKLPFIESGFHDNDVEHYYLDANYSDAFIFINKSKVKDNGFNSVSSYLEKNPVSVVFKLASPIYEPIKANLSVDLFEGTTYISNNSNIPANMEITVDRVLNRAVEAIELAKLSPTVENLARARMWSNLIKESVKKDELQGEINDITDIEDLELERKSVTANMDLYVKSENALSMSLSTNSITFEGYNGTEDLEKLNAVDIVVSSSLPYDLNAYLEESLQNSDKSSVMSPTVVNIKESSNPNYNQFINNTDKVVLKSDCDASNDKNYSIDLKLASEHAHKADVYKAVIKFEAVQK